MEGITNSYRQRRGGYDQTAARSCIQRTRNSSGVDRYASNCTAHAFICIFKLISGFATRISAIASHEPNFCFSIYKFSYFLAQQLGHETAGQGVEDLQESFAMMGDTSLTSLTSSSEDSSSSAPTGGVSGGRLAGREQGAGPGDEGEECASGIDASLYSYVGMDASLALLDTRKTQTQSRRSGAGAAAVGFGHRVLGTVGPERPSPIGVADGPVVAAGEEATSGGLSGSVSAADLRKLFASPSSASSPLPRPSSNKTQSGGSWGSNGSSSGESVGMTGAGSGAAPRHGVADMSESVMRLLQTVKRLGELVSK